MKQKKSRIVIEYTPGSDFQKRSMSEAIFGMIFAWKSFYEDRHKKNKIIVTEEHDLL